MSLERSFGNRIRVPFPKREIHSGKVREVFAEIPIVLSIQSGFQKINLFQKTSENANPVVIGVVHYHFTFSPLFLAVPLTNVPPMAPTPRGFWRTGTSCFLFCFVQEIRMSNPLFRPRFECTRNSSPVKSLLGGERS